MDRTNSQTDSLTKRTTDTLRQMIVEGVLNLGEALSESKVARLLGVSRTPVREAFAHLEIEGLVFSEPQRRTRVFLLGPRDVDDICDVRCCLEKMALALAMKGDRHALFSLLSDAAMRMTKAIQAGDIAEYLRVDRQFHQVVFDCADNMFLNDAYQTIATKMAALRTRLATRPDYLRKGLGEHLRLCELIRSGDLEGALNILEEHVSRKEDSFWHLNDGLADAEIGNKTEHQAGKTTAARNMPAQLDRKDRILDPALVVAKRRESRWEIGLSDDNFVDELLPFADKKKVIKSDHSKNKIDEISPATNIVDVKSRGRPRVHTNSAARKRAWAARERAKKKAERLTSGPAKKRGRPRKYTTQAERQEAYEKRRRQSRTTV
jgi:DNA-binding GntR family transcriptional regulator